MLKWLAEMREEDEEGNPVHAKVTLPTEYMNLYLAEIQAFTKYYASYNGTQAGNPSIQ
jgi:hypothetical protein